METVQEGDTITVEYEGRLEDGTVFDSSEKYEDPLEFTIGEGQLIKGFENAIIGMVIGQEKEIKLEPSEAYGQYNPEYVKKMPKDMFPENEEINAGMVYFLNLPDGRQYPVRVSEVEEETITIDLNPPLAGKTLVFKIKLLKINE